MDWRKLTNDWVYDFQRRYLSDFEKQLLPLVKELFLIGLKETKTM
jgi:hypothetical protein